MIALCLVGVFSCRKNDEMFKSLPSEKSGIHFVNELTPSEDLNILTYLYYYNGAGVAVADFNNDGFNDIYFTSNQGADKLYINRQNLKFEDVTEISGIDNATGWSTGVTHVDINGDGLLDIYLCKVGNYKSIKGSNLLYINQGMDANNVPVFKESAQAYGLDLIAFSTQAAFFDYDLDGDLDMYLLSHSVHPNHSYGKGENRQGVDSLAGDRLFENINGVFKDVSREAGIYQGRIGYGLGLAIGDLNNDGYPDIYIGNDFFEHDYLYRNNGDKTFTELNSKDFRILGHTSHYSMGNSIADINNDGKMDIMSLDMLPEDLVTLKSSGVEDGYPVYNRFLKNGYSPQFMQNTLHINRGNWIFSEVGFQSGIAATEWSWGILVTDYDMDGFKDLYVTNGILGATNDMDYINFISQDLIQNDIGKSQGGVSLDFTKYIPEKKVTNYAFKNNGNASFTEVTDQWFKTVPSFSNGGAYADLDNDGDLDLVISNVNENAFIFENLSNNRQTKNFITFKFRGPKDNFFGIGVKVEIFADDLYISEENFPVKSYLSSVPNDIVMGLGSHQIIDSIKVIWPNSRVQKLSKVEANQTIVLAYLDALPFESSRSTPPKSINYISNTDIQIDFVHHEETTLDFDRDPLVPFALSNEGPRIAVGDVNGDLLDDIFIGGGKFQASQLFIQNKEGAFVSSQSELFQSDSKSEDVDQLFFDADNDSDLDLLVVSGGNEFIDGEPLKPRLYINNSGIFEYREAEFQNISINASVIRAVDIDNDGDNDVIICSNSLPGKFGESASNYIFRNDGTGHFEDVSQLVGNSFQQAGLITDVAIADIDKNGFMDIVAVGTWMPITLFMNDGKSLTQVQLAGTHGWWKSIAIEDFDKDGDLDFVAGNWGHNSRLSATSKEPIRLYRNDFDDNGDAETLITYFHRGQETFIASMDELSKQLPFIRKKYPTYREFASARVDEVFSSGKLNNAMKKEVKTLSTSYFENDGNNNFICHVLPATAQQSSVNSIAIDDFNNDGYLDLLLLGNNYELSTQLGRLDASHGVLLLNDQAGFFQESETQNFNISGPARDIKKVNIRGQVHYVITINNDKPVFLKK